MTHTTTLTREQKARLREYITERLCEIAGAGEIEETETISIEDLGGMECEVRVNYDGRCRDTRSSDLPTVRHIDASYSGEAAFYSKKTGKPLHSVPVSGRINESLY